MIAVEPFRSEHLEQLDLQPAQEHMRTYLTPDLLSKLESSSPAYSILDDGRTLACLGFFRWTDDAGIIWAYPARNLGRRMIIVHRCAARAISALPGKVFAAVEHDFDEGHRWMDLLGFERVSHVAEYGPARRPHDVYMRAH